jgi:hypothetical protein
MKTFDDDDSKLREIIRDIKLDSPGKDFTMHVLDRIHKEVPFAFQIKKEPMFGRGFWAIIISFVVLGAAIFILSGTMPDTEGTIGKFLGSMNTGSATNTYKGVISFFNGVPAGITGILLASSLLIFLERFLSMKKSKA